MIGLVLVSHSAKIAEGARELALQMTQDVVQIAVAGGMDDPDHPIGTDPMKVLEAINAVYHEDGVIVLMDLGSALMSAETAIEFLEPAWQGNIHLCEAPIIEGSVAAAVQASIGSPLALVLEEARNALQAKQSHLAGRIGNVASPTNRSQAAAILPESAEALTVIVPNAQGIHARPAARIVSIAGQYQATLTIHKADHKVNAKSINQVALLNAQQGDEITFHASGTDASQALQAIQALVDDNFGDDDTHQPTPKKPSQHLQPSQSNNGVIYGIAASAGFALGKVFRLNEQLPQIDAAPIEDVDSEQAQLRGAIQEATKDLQQLFADTKQTIGSNQASIFEAQILLLQDEVLQQPAFERISHQKHNAAAAWWQAIEELAQQYRDASSDYLQERANDVLDVGKRVLRKLIATNDTTLAIPENSILVATDITPSDTAQLSPKHVNAIITEIGGATSHTAIIARSLGIPAVVGLGAAIATLVDQETIIVDGTTGHVQLQPTDAEINAIRAKIEESQRQRQALIEQSQQTAITTDGHEIEIVANIGTPRDATGLQAHGAEGVGLFRTELLFMDRQKAPTEAEQLAAYVETAKNIPDCPIVIRTLDVGGDKAISYIHIAEEDNPFLGYRGIRYWLGNEPLAKTQMRAICRASAAHNIKMMFPMIGTIDELQAAKALLASVHEELQQENLDFNPQMEVGMMIEVPAAVMLADQFAAEVDFFSIGTNDLTQYMMAADRGNAEVSALVNPFQPAVLRAIKQVVDAAHSHKKWVGLCGELAGNPHATKLLVGLGLDELSMSVPSLPTVKALIRKMSYADAKTIAAHALTLQSATEVLAYLDTQSE